MKTQTVPTIYITWQRRKLQVPGGWKLRVPEILELDQATTKAYSLYFQRVHGLTKVEAEAKTREVFTDLLVANWFRMQTMAIRRWAKEYAKSFPSKINKDGTLEGFRPEKLQNVYVPGLNTGRAGKSSVRKLFREMANEED